MQKYKQINRMILDVDPNISHEKVAYASAYASAYAYAAAYASYASYASYTAYAAYVAVDKNLLEKLFKALVFNDLSAQQLKNEVLK